MPKDEGKSVKLMRSPIDTHCGNPECKKPLPFGVWVYYNPETNNAICPECGVKRGWSPKQRVKQLIQSLELKEDIKTLKKERKMLGSALILLKQKINLHRLGENDLALENQIVRLMDTVKDYLKHCGSSEEKEALENVFAVIRQTQDLQKELRNKLQNSLLLVEKKETKLEKKANKITA